MANLLHEITEIRRVPVQRRNEGEEKDAVSVRCVRARNVKPHGLDPVVELQQVRLNRDERERSELLAGDLLVVVSGTANRVAMVQQEHVGCVAQGHLVVLRPLDSGAGDRLLRYLQGDEGQQNLESLRVGAVVSTIRVADLRDIRIP